MDNKGIYKKLSVARAKLQNTQLKKSGKNTFSKYEYFELSDFLPHINIIFNDVGLCSHITFKDGVAILAIFDTDDNSSIEFSTPTVNVELKGATQIQCLGAQHTYIRRYLWVLAMEISENDIVDETHGNDRQKGGQQTPIAKPNLALNTETFNKVKLHFDKASIKNEALIKIKNKYNLSPEVESALINHMEVA